MDILVATFLILPFLAVIIAFSGSFSAKSRYNAKFVKYNNEFNEIYMKLVDEHLDNIDEERKITKSKIIVGIIINVVFIICFAFFREKSIWISLCLLIGIVLLVYICVKAISNYKRIYKESYGEFIVKPFVKYLNDKLVYHKEDGISEELYRNLKFDEKKFNTYFKDDLISGQICEGTDINMSEVRTLDIHLVRKDVVKKEIFWGMCGYINLNNRIPCEVRIKKDRFKFLNKVPRINMSSADFEKHFDVFSMNKNVTKELITADVMSILTNFYTEYEIEFEIILKDDYMYFRFYTGEMFEGNLFSSTKNVRSLWLYYSIYNFLVYLARQFNASNIIQEDSYGYMKEENKSESTNYDTSSLNQSVNNFDKFDE